MAAKTMKTMLENSKNLTWMESVVTVKSGVKADTAVQIEALARELLSDNA